MIVSAYEELQLDNSVVALGKFQGLHTGHMLLVDKVCEISREKSVKSVICSINFKDNERINTDMERYNILKYKGIDYVANCEFNEAFAAMSPEDFFTDIIINKFHASYVVVGADFRFGHKRLGDASLLLGYGSKYNIDIIIIDKYAIDGDVVSSSRIKEFIKEGAMEQVIRYMGRPYIISGEVMHGNMLGRTIGYPTVNIYPDKDKLLPPYGVYATMITIDNVNYRAMTNIGVRPTVSDMASVSVESNIFDYQGDLYGKNICVSFIEFIRKEKKFDNVDELMAQIKEDKEQIINSHQ